MERVAGDFFNSIDPQRTSGPFGRDAGARHILNMYTSRRKRGSQTTEIESMKPLVAAIFFSFVAQVAFAQSPYAGMQTRSIKALSEQQIADLKAGRGMGLALPAELNGYPGPIHVLELSDKLGLSSEQKSRIEDLFQSMRAEAVPLGEKLLAQEAA